MPFRAGPSEAECGVVRSNNIWGANYDPDSNIPPDCEAGRTTWIIVSRPRQRPRDSCAQCGFPCVFVIATTSSVLKFCDRQGMRRSQGLFASDLLPVMGVMLVVTPCTSRYTSDGSAWSSQPVCTNEPARYLQAVPLQYPCLTYCNGSIELGVLARTMQPTICRAVPATLWQQTFNRLRCDPAQIISECQPSIRFLTPSITLVFLPSPKKRALNKVNSVLVPMPSAPFYKSTNQRIWSRRLRSLTPATRRPGPLVNLFQRTFESHRC